MPIIPRYQAGGGPRTEGLGHAGAYSPPDGSDWRLLARATDAAGAVLAGLPRQAPKTPAEGRASAKPENHLLGQAGEVRWRRERLEADAEDLDVEAVSRSRRQAAEALPEGARAVFDALTAPREAGFAAEAASRAGQRVREAAWALSVERQALGVEEYLKLADVAPEQAMAALGSAVSELASQLRHGGGDQAEILSAQRDLVSATQVERVTRVLDSDPARAGLLLEQSSGIAPAERERLAGEIEAEQLRRGVQREVGRWVVDDPSLATDQSRLQALATQAGGADEALSNLYQGAAFSEWRGGQARAAALEAEAWAAVELLLLDGRARSWTDLPTRAWQALSPRQQAQFRISTERPAVDDAAAWDPKAPFPVRETEALATTPRLVRASYAPPEAPDEPWGLVPPQVRLTLAQRRLNARLGGIRYPDGLLVDPDTGQVFKLQKRHSGNPLDGPGGQYRPVLASEEEARMFRRNRLSIDPSEADTPLKEELLLQALGTKGNRDWVPEPGDELLLARMIFAEGAGTPGDHEAIGWSIINRIGHPENGDTLTAVLRDRKGFQIVPEGGGPPGGSPLWRKSEKPEEMEPLNRQSWDNAQRVAKGILAGRIDDPVDGGRFFYASPKAYDGKNPATANPGWFQEALRNGKIVPVPYKSRATGKSRNYFFRDEQLR